MMFRLVLVALPALALSACNTPQPQAPGAASYQALPAGVSPANFRLPDQPGCAGDVARFQSIIDNDLATGHTTKSVRDAVTADLGRAQKACDAGRDAEGSAIVAATRKKFGYPGS